MASTKKQVKRLKKDAQRLWSDQQDLLNRANGVARDAIPHAQHFAESFYDDRVRPTVKKGQSCLFSLEDAVRVSSVGPSTTPVFPWWILEA